VVPEIQCGESSDFTLPDFDFVYTTVFKDQIKGDKKSRWSLLRMDDLQDAQDLEVWFG
jgi:hypothetical protein